MPTTKEKDFNNISSINTLGALKASGHKSKSLKEEMRANLISKLQNNDSPFKGIHGYEDTVIPEIERAILAGHNINLLGLRGQAKTRMARQLINLLDEYIPIIAGNELNDNPLKPITKQGQKLISQHGDQTPIEWLSREERYIEKLATPDVSIADLIGDIDPVKAINEKLSYSDESVIHFGLIPRSHRCIFVMNELPDLQARIQVALFNILEEGDIQIRGFKLRLPLEIQFVFTANPEDYTSRGSIITPLKDRIGSQIITHYPQDIQLAKTITKQEAKITKSALALVKEHELINDIIEQIVFEARENEYVDQKSGVSARLSISARELLFSAVERRVLKNSENQSSVRITDLEAIIPAMTGKIEMVYEGEQEGVKNVSQILIGKAIRHIFLKYFPSPETKKRKENQKDVISPYDDILSFFEKGETLSLYLDDSNASYQTKLNKLAGLDSLVKTYIKGEDDNSLIWKEFVLYSLAEFSKLSKTNIQNSVKFGDLLNSMFQF